MLSRENLLFYPELPHPRTAMFKICRRMHYLCSNVPSECQSVGFKWKDATKFVLDPLIFPYLSHIRMFNTGCVDISKRAVFRAYRTVFHNELEVDPLTFSGQVVCKSNRNAAHDGVVLNAPLEYANPDKTYSILIRNTEAGEVVDFRVPLMVRHIPFVYVKRRPISQRFSNRNSLVSLVPADEAFSNAEIAKLLAMARCLGVEYGELDVLRDACTGKIYVVDVNNTPFGPPNGLPQAACDEALEILCQTFHRAFVVGE